jgi:hypothetical protein
MVLFFILYSILILLYYIVLINLFVYIVLFNLILFSWFIFIIALLYSMVNNINYLLL